MSKKDYYAILGIQRDSTEEEIKKAYRKLAMQYHPDRNQGNPESESKFKEINEAYGVLGDANKRNQYDRFGSVGGDAGFSGFSGDVDLSDIFEGFFSGGFGNTRRKSSVRKGEDLEYIMKLDLKSSIYGVKEKIHFSRYEGCGKCDGEGGSGKESCKKCHGSGYVKYRQESFFGVIESSRECSDCSGEGNTFKHICTECNGKKRVKKEVDIEVDVPAGIDDGMIIKLTGEGNAGVGTKAKGDLYIKFQVNLEEKGLIRDGIDLTYTLEIDFLEAILGNQKEVAIPILGKRKLKIVAGTQFGTILKFPGDGVKDVQRDSKGDLFIELHIAIPKKVSKKEKDMYLKLASERKIEVSGDDSILGKIFG